jgi:hypothetical protein
MATDVTDRGREILAVLEACGGRRGEAARRLGLSRQGLYYHLHKLGARVAPSSPPLPPTKSATSTTKPRAPIPPISEPVRDKRLAEILVFDPSLPVDHPLVTPEDFERRREADRRRIQVKEAWWRTRLEVVDLPPAIELPGGILRQSLTLDINQHLTRGEIEIALTLGIRAMHEARGEVANEIDGVHLRGARP